MTMDWLKVADELESFVRDTPDDLLDPGQRATVAELAGRIRNGGRAILLADEVGMGKTRIAVALIEAVRRAGGRSAIILPAGLGVQWQKELRCFNPDDRTLLPLRSYDSFIAGFLDDDDAKGTERYKRSHRERLMDRRQHRELPGNGWADERVLMISHNLANMRFQERGNQSWRWELLPAIRYALSGDRRNQRERGSLEMVRATHRAADSIAATIRKYKLEPELAENHHRLEPSEFRSQILPLIGYGLGQFDLVVVDEAHKSRGDTSLSRILGQVAWESKIPFRLGMTATPVELNADQWINTLGRIGAHDKDGEIQNRIQDYVDIVRKINAEELDDQITSQFECAAKKFHEALRPFVLRRDKRDDPDFRAFHDLYGDYRQIRDLTVTPETENAFNLDWLRRFCAAEALSMSSQTDMRVKKLRLSLAQGYSLDAVVNGFRTSPEDGCEDEEFPEAVEEPVNSCDMDEEMPSLDMSQIWWDAISNKESDPDTHQAKFLYSHPAILATVKLIENYTAKGEKVLVFGRFIKPIDALTRLLDAREMLRRLSAKRHWPASSVPEKSRLAVQAAMLDPTIWIKGGGIADIDAVLAERYKQWAKKRGDELEQLRHELIGMKENSEENSKETVDKLLSLLQPNVVNDLDLQADIGALLEALTDLRGGLRDQPWAAGDLVRQFDALQAELIGEDDDAKSADALQSRLDTYLGDYSGREGNFSRMMYSKTAPQTRRLLQAAFNRAESWPMVLLAQSRVGREGLNLHEACRTVVLLHAEWNPGIVEQQIGRVDRKNSRWLCNLREWESKGSVGDPPRIRIHPVVVRGTYDDHNWQVLRERWSELRAQLHGDVLPWISDRPTATPDKQAMVERIRRATPSFAPPPLE